MSNLKGLTGNCLVATSSKWFGIIVLEGYSYHIYSTLVEYRPWTSGSFLLSSSSVCLISALDKNFRVGCIAASFITFPRFTFRLLEKRSA